MVDSRWNMRVKKATFLIFDCSEQMKAKNVANIKFEYSFHPLESFCFKNEEFVFFSWQKIIIQRKKKYCEKHIHSVIILLYMKTNM